MIAVVDDEELVRTALERLLQTSGYNVAAFPSAEAFLSSGRLQKFVVSLPTFACRECLASICRHA